MVISTHSRCFTCPKLCPLPCHMMPSIALCPMPSFRHELQTRPACWRFQSSFQVVFASVARQVPSSDPSSGDGEAAEPKVSASFPAWAWPAQRGGWHRRSCWDAPASVQSQFPATFAALAWPTAGVAHDPVAAGSIGSALAGSALVGNFASISSCCLLGASIAKDLQHKGLLQFHHFLCSQNELVSLAHWPSLRRNCHRRTAQANATKREGSSWPSGAELT